MMPKLLMVPELLSSPGVKNEFMSMLTELIVPELLMIPLLVDKVPVISNIITGSMFNVCPIPTVKLVI